MFGKISFKKLTRGKNYTVMCFQKMVVTETMIYNAMVMYEEGGHAKKCTSGDPKSIK